MTSASDSTVRLLGPEIRTATAAPAISVHITASAIRRLVAKIGPSDAAGHWPWQSALSRDGYSYFRLSGKVVIAHRLVFSLWRGDIPAGAELDHVCRLRSCVNPAHLEVVSHRENLRRGAASRRAEKSRAAALAALAML
jgi:hypothetical protein